MDVRVATLPRPARAALTGYGLEVVDTDTLWVLVHRPGLRELLAPHGIVVRDCTSFGLCGVARVAVPDDDGRGPPPWPPNGWRPDRSLVHPDVIDDSPSSRCTNEPKTVPDGSLARSA